MKVLSTGVLLATLLSGVQAFVPFKAPVAAPVTVRARLWMSVSIVGGVARVGAGSAAAAPVAGSDIAAAADHRGLAA